MSNVPLPNRSCIVTYMGNGKGLHYSLGVSEGTRLIEQPPGSQLDLYTADQMHSHAAAVSAAKDAEIAQLRADLIKSLAAPVVREPLTKERLQRHALFAADAPPSSAVVLLSSLHRLLGITGGGNG